MQTSTESVSPVSLRLAADFSAEETQAAFDEAYKAFAWEFMAKNPTRVQIQKPAVVSDESKGDSDNTVPPAQPTDAAPNA